MISEFNVVFSSYDVYFAISSTWLWQGRGTSRFNSSTCGGHYAASGRCGPKFVSALFASAAPAAAAAVESGHVGHVAANNGRQRSADVIATIVSDRAPRCGPGNTLQLYGGRRETRVSVLHHIQLLTNDHQDTVTVSSLNVRSLGNKYVALRDLIVSNRLHLFAVVESWHESASCPAVIGATRHRQATDVSRRPVRALRLRKPSARTSTVAVFACFTNCATLFEILRYLCIAQRSHLQSTYKAVE